MGWGLESLDLGEGDVLTVPRKLVRRYHNPTGDRTIVYVVRGGDSPAPPAWAGPGTPAMRSVPVAKH